MRYLIALTLTMISGVAWAQIRKVKLTVILFDSRIDLDNRTPKLKATKDTLLKRKEIDLLTTTVDIFFSNKNFHLPYYVPTGGIYKNEIKDNECNMKIYPSNVKCYEYDVQKRVIKMNVSGSGTINNFVYKFNNKNQIIEVIDSGYDRFFLTYNPNGTLSELLEEISRFKKKLVFIYSY